MKHKGCNLEFAEERVKDIMQVYDSYINQCQYIRMDEAAKYVASAPAKKFYVSPERASKVMYKLLKGDTSILKNMWGLRREMFEEIYKRLLLLREKFPKKNIYELCIMIVEQPAPKFYLKSESIERIISKNRIKWNKIKRQRIPILYNRFG